MSKTKTATTSTRGTATVRDYPNVTPDGLTWLDPAGNPPQFSIEGHLERDFLLTDDLGRRTIHKAGKTRAPMPHTARAWSIYQAACDKARESKRKAPTSVLEAVRDELKKAGAESDVALPVVVEVERVELPPVQNPVPVKAKKASTREPKSLVGLSPKALYDRLWNVAKRQGPEAFAQFKADWKAGRIEGSPHGAPSIESAAETAQPVEDVAKPPVVEDKPVPGKVYALTDFKAGGPCIAAGNTWAESEVPESDTVVA